MVAMQCIRAFLLFQPLSLAHIACHRCIGYVAFNELPHSCNIADVVLITCPSQLYHCKMISHPILALKKERRSDTAHGTLCIWVGLWDKDAEIESDLKVGRQKKKEPKKIDHFNVRLMGRERWGGGYAHPTWWRHDRWGDRPHPWSAWRAQLYGSPCTWL